MAEKPKKQIPLRVSEKLYNQLAAWAEDDFRSINGQIEYLLTENGNLRLKGYNHFNDRNHTMRTAITTQGLGLIYKHDFNTWKNFFEFSNIKLFTEEDEYEEEEYEEEEIDEYEITQPTDTVITITPDILE